MDDRELFNEIAARLGLGGKAGGITFSALWARYYREEGRYLGTARDVAKRGEYLLAAWGDRPAQQITTSDAETYRDQRKKQVTRRRRPPAPASINRELAIARRCLQWAVEQRPALLPYNPLAGVTMEPENNVRRTKLRTEEELQRLLEHADPTMRALILAQIDCGFRRMEVFSLQWTQIALVRYRDRAGEIRVRPMVDLWRTKAARAGDINSDGRRRAALSDRTWQAICDLPRFGRYVFCGREPNNQHSATWTPRPDTHLAPGATLQKFKRLVKKAGLQGVDGEPITFHTLRHSFAYLTRVRDHVTERSAMKQAGWKTRAAFDRYGIGDEDELSAMYETVDANIRAELARLASLKKPDQE